MLSFWTSRDGIDWHHQTSVMGEGGLANCAGMANYFICFYFVSWACFE
jgi:hypothetical protein